MINSLIEPMANDALRTICIAYKDYVRSKASQYLRQCVCQGVYVLPGLCMRVSLSVSYHRYHVADGLA